MIAAWMAYATVLAAIFGVAAVVIERGFRSAQLPGRWAVAAAMLAAVVVPMVMRIQPTITSAELVSAPAAAPRIAIPQMVSVLPAPDGLVGLDAPLAVAWTVLTAVVLSLLIGTQIRVAKASRRYARETVDGTPVLRSRSLGPAVVGWLKGSIVLPLWFDREAGERRSMMMLHEKEHLRGGDSQLLFASVLLAALQPWNLPLWWMVIRMRAAIELDCDRRVLRSGVDVRAYGDLLLDMSLRRSKAGFPLMAFAVTRSFLARRFDHIAFHFGRARYVTAGIATMLGVACVLLACSVPPPVQADDRAQPGEQETAAPLFDSTVAVLPVFGAPEEPPVAVMGIEEFLEKVARLATVTETADTTSLAGVPDDVLAVLRTTAVLLEVSERDGRPTVLMRELTARGREQLLRINAIESGRARPQNP